MLKILEMLHIGSQHNPPGTRFIHLEKYGLLYYHPSTLEIYWDNRSASDNNYKDIITDMKNFCSSRAISLKNFTFFQRYFPFIQQHYTSAVGEDRYLFYCPIWGQAYYIGLLSTGKLIASPYDKNDPNFSIILHSMEISCADRCSIPMKVLRKILLPLSNYLNA